MTVIDLHSFCECPQSNSPTVLCLGSFDGVHLGHRQLAKEALRACEELKKSYPTTKSGAWFFSELPQKHISGVCPPLLCDTRTKLEIFAELGLDVAFIYDFDDICTLSPNSFVNNILKEECGCIYTVCGYNFKFGYRAKGDAGTLRDLMDGRVSVIEPVKYGDMDISSSKIRELISMGNVELAAKLLERSYFLSAEVQHGKKLGRTLDFPTVNQSFSKGHAIPKKGIYISMCIIDGRAYPSVSNVGTRPSVENNADLNCETHIIDFDGDVYGKTIKVEFIKRIRDELKFETLAALKSRVLYDIELTKEYFKNI